MGKSKSDVALIMADTFKRLDALRDAGQKEYAHDDTNAFANFDRVSLYLNINREKVLWTYLQKHLDGIVAYINGHRSQRESVHGRIDDAHVYLELLRAMILEEPNQKNEVVHNFLNSVAIDPRCNCNHAIRTCMCPVHSIRGDIK